MVLPRLYLGVIFSVAGWAKASDPATFDARLGQMIEKMLPHAQPSYRAFAESVVIPNHVIFANLVIGGECCVAVAMLLGLTTRLAALVAVFLLGNYLLLKGLPFWSPASNDVADIVLAVVVGLGAAGRSFGVDRALAARWTNVPLW